MDYNLVDYRNLVSMWYNEFLPTVVGDRIGVVEDAGILYLRSFNLEQHKRESVKFILERLSEMSRDFDSTIVVREVRPVNNPTLAQFLHYVENTDIVDPEHRTKIMNIANRRYNATSSDIIISQDKETIEFVDRLFGVLSSKLHMPRVKFYSSGSFTFDGVCSTASEFFPRNSLNIQGKYDGAHIKVNSSNDIINRISDGMMKGRQTDSSISKFIASSRKSMLKDFEMLI